MNAPINPLAPSLTVEKAVLGALLLSDGAYWKVESVLRPEHFAFPINQKIYGAIKTICDAGQRITLSKLVALIGEEYDDGLSTNNLLGALLNDADKSEDGSVWQTFVEDIIENWRKRQIRAQAEWLAKKVMDPSANSDDLFMEMKNRIEAVEANSQSAPIRWIKDVAAEAVRASKDARETGILPGFDTGLPSLDEIIGRFYETDLGVIGARQGDGKTIIAGQLAKHAAKFGTVAFFQLEMRDVDMGRRALAEGANLSANEIKEGAFDLFAAGQLEESLRELSGLPIVIDDRPRLMLDQIVSRIRSLKRSHGLRTVFIDHLRLINVRGAMRDKFEKYPIITMELKALAKELNLTIVLLSQVTRQSQRRDEPNLLLTDLDGGGALEQDADWVIGAWRWDQWLEGREPSGASDADYAKYRERLNKVRDQIEIAVLKRRSGKSSGRRVFEFDGRLSVIREIEK